MVANRSNIVYIWLIILFASDTYIRKNRMRFNCNSLSSPTGEITMRKGLCSCVVFLLASIFPVALQADESVRVLEETPDAISIVVDVPAPVFRPSKDSGSVCTLEGFHQYTVCGVDGLAARGVMVAVPPGSTAAIRIEVRDVQEFSGIYLAAAQTQSGGDCASFDVPCFQYAGEETACPVDEFVPAQPASLTSVGIVRGMHGANILITPLQYNPAQRRLRVVRSMVVTLELSGEEPGKHKNLLQHNALSEEPGAVFEDIKRAIVINPESPFVHSVARPAQPFVFTQPPADFEESPFAIRIVTSGAGIYRVRYEDISGIGADLTGLTNSNLKISNQGQEIALYRNGTGTFGSGDYILFYAEDFQGEYSTTNVYWLYQGTDDGLTMQTSVGAPVSGFPQPDSFRTVLRLEQDTTWRRNLPDYVDGEDQWLWRQLFNFSLTTYNINFTLIDFATDAGNFNIELYLRALTEFDHLTGLSLNGTPVADVEWEGAVVEREIFSGISPVLFNEGANTLTVELLPTPDNNPPTFPDVYYLNWAELDYARRYIAENNRLSFGCDIPGGATFEVSGFANPDIMVFDVSQPALPVLLTGTDITTPATSQVRFERTVDASSQLYACTMNAAFSPDELVVDEPSDLMSPRSGVDYIIITHSLFASTVEQLKTIREASGLGVEIVFVQDIYDEFSYGIKDVAAIKDFLTYAYNYWHATDHPTYVALVGDATYDYRDILGRAAEGKADLVPTYLGYRGSLGSSVGAVASDNWFVAVDGDDPLPDMVIGRLCVKNTQDFLNILDKITTYEATSSEQWQSRLLFAADTDEFNQFEALSDILEGEVPNSYTLLRLNLREYDTDIATATDDLVAAISDGVLLTSYIGHGSTDTWSKRAWLRTPNQNTGVTRDDVARLTNMDMYTFLVVLNCLSGTFSEVTDDYSTAEEFVRQPERGAIACVAPSASAAPEDHEVLGTVLYKNLFQNHVTTLGTLLTLSKIDAYALTASRDILETFIFFGDPALGLKVPEVIDPPPEDIGLIEPVDTAQIPIAPTPLFRWEPGAYTLFKIEFSASGLFEGKKDSFFAPRKKKLFISGDSYVPETKEWKKILKFYRQNGIVFWRIAAYDPATLEVLEYSDIFNFGFEAQPPDGIFGDPSGEIWTIAPSDGAQLPVEPVTLFSWEPGAYTLFKIEFSRSGLFDSKKDFFSVPRKSDEFIAQEQHTPDFKEWRKVQKFFKKRGVVFWRVVAYDPVTLAPLDYSDFSSFGF